MLQGTDAVYLARHEGRAPMRLTASIGSRYPAAPTAVGNALLTTLGDAEIIVAELRDGVRRLTNPLYRAALASG